MLFSQDIFQTTKLLASALYPDPKVLILDDGTANLDAENEDTILESFQALDITRIAVAHRPATLEAAERTILIDRGQGRNLNAIKQAKAKHAGLMNRLNANIDSRHHDLRVLTDGHVGE